MAEKPTYEELVEKVKGLEEDSVESNKIKKELFRIKRAIETTCDAIGVTDSQGSPIYHNKALTDLFGYTAKELKEAGGPNILYKSHDVAEEVFEAIMSGESWNGELDMVSRTGQEFPVSLHADAIKDDAGKLFGVIGVHRDITELKEKEDALRKAQNELERRVGERTIELSKANEQLILEIEEKKLAEEALRENETRFRALSDATFEGIAFTKQGILVDANRQFANIFAYDVNDLQGLDVNKLVAPEDQELVQSRILSGSEELYEHRAICKDGTMIFVEVRPRMMSIKGLPMRVTAIRDITERKRAEEALRERTAHLRTLIQTIPDLIWLKDQDGVYLSCNAKFERFFGAKEADIVGKTDYDFVDKELADFFRKNDRLAMDSGNPCMNEEEVTYADDGHRELLETIKTPMYDSEDNLIGILGIARDITDRKRSQQALKASEERLRTIFGAAENVSLIMAAAENEQNSNPLIFEFSPGAENVFGYKREEVMGKPVAILHVPEDAVKIAKMSKKMRKTKEGFNGEITLLRKSGDKFPALLSTHPLLDEEGKMYAAVGVSIDISNQKQLEAQLRQMEKVEAIGTLAGGIAHEFNNALSGIFGYIEILKMDFPEDENIEKYTEPMMESSRRMARLTNQLLAYAGGGKYQEKIISLNDFVENTLPILQHSVDSEIRVETDLTSDVLNIKADITQMQMVLSAAIKNASEAIDGQGKIRITTNAVAVDTVFAESHPELKTGSYVCIAIKDDGSGMDDETVTRIFEPFFTTKFQGRGLGMAAAYGIVRNHEGLIVVDSEWGKGTEIRIYLPAAEVEIKEPKKPKVEVSSGTGTILLIEDEHIVMDVTRELLERLGYRVLAAKTGKEAIDIAESFDGGIDLALLDIRLPDMDGGIVYPIIKKARPDLKVIVCSGYAIDGPAQEVLDAGAQGFIQKPYSLVTLSGKLKKVFESK